MLRIFQIKDFLKNKFKLKKEEKKEEISQEEIERLIKVREERIKEKRALCKPLIEAVKKVEIFISKEDGSETKITEETKERFIQELETFRDNDKIDHIVNEEVYESFGTTITDYLIIQNHQIHLVTRMYEEFIAASSHTHYNQPDAMLMRYQTIKETEKENQKKKGIS